MSVEFYSRIPTIKSQAIPYQTLDTPLRNKGFLPPEERHNWLRDYEQLEGNIFNYYNVQNEIDFLKKANGLSDDKKQYYLQENVRRFLGEFVGKVPYSTIPYEIDKKGISYAGMYVMDSYDKTAKIGGERERSEAEGFRDIELTYSQSMKEKIPLPTAVWISPPKVAHYGFVFVFIPDKQGHVKEYILRYPEHIDSLKKSEEIYRSLSPSLPPKNTDDFLKNPLFDRVNQKPKEILDSILYRIGISPHEIEKSHIFEKSVNSALSEWIASYSSLIMSLTSYEKGSPFYRYGVLEAKKMLLAIYQKAEELKTELFSSIDQIRPVDMSTYTISLPVDDLRRYAAVLQNQEKNLPTTAGGSCPAIQNTDDPFSPPLPFMDNVTALTTLTKEIPLEKAYKDAEYFSCPKCGGAIPSGKGIEVCPHCGITKQQYAKMVNSSQCD